MVGTMGIAYVWVVLDNCVRPARSEKADFRIGKRAFENGNQRGCDDDIAKMSAVDEQYSFGIERQVISSLWGEGAQDKMPRT